MSQEPLSNLDLSKMFSDTPFREVTLGIELEAHIVEYDDFWNTYNPLEDEDIISEILSDYSDKYVYRDYYPYQAEIRSKPSNDPTELVEDFVERYKHFEDLLNDWDLYLIPLSTVRCGEVMCGMHIHLSIDSGKTTDLVKLGYSMYPYMLLIGKFTSSSKLFSRLRNLSRHWSRLVSSRHIKTVDFYEPEYMQSSPDRYYDWIINRSTDNTRLRVKDVVTLEYRLFDVVGDTKSLQKFIESIKIIAEHINIDYYFADFQYLEQYRSFLSFPRRPSPFIDVSVNKLKNYLGLPLNTKKDSWIGDELFKVSSLKARKYAVEKYSWFN